MQEDYEVIARPSETGDIGDGLLAKLVASESDGTAVKINMRDKHLINFQSNLRNRLRKFGLKLRYKYDKTKKELVCWTEKSDEEQEEPTE